MVVAFQTLKIHDNTPLAKNNVNTFLISTESGNNFIYFRFDAKPTMYGLYKNVRFFFVSSVHKNTKQHVIESQIVSS